MSRLPNRITLVSLCLWMSIALLAGCAQAPGEPAPATPEEPTAEQQDWAIAIHGGAGALPPDMDVAGRDSYLASLETALNAGKAILEEGGSSLDAVETVIRLMEDDPNFNAGRGAVFNHRGENELDASIMDGSTLACGAVAGVRTVRNPISLARKVMTETRHVLFAADGAEKFADEMGVERVDPKFFFVQDRYDRLKAVQAEQAASEDDKKGTVGVAALDRSGNLAAGTSTGGLTNKRYGRVGDSPIIGAGTYANNETCAVSATGVGEEFIRHGVTRTISALMEYSAGAFSVPQSI